jgi:hypothetical protein
MARRLNVVESNYVPTPFPEITTATIEVKRARLLKIGDIVWDNVSQFVKITSEPRQVVQWIPNYKFSCITPSGYASEANGCFFLVKIEP